MGSVEVGIYVHKYPFRISSFIPYILDIGLEDIPIHLSVSTLLRSESSVMRGNSRNTQQSSCYSSSQLYLRNVVV